jgi:hypothetical protein
MVYRRFLKFPVVALSVALAATVVIVGCGGAAEQGAAAPTQAAATGGGAAAPAPPTDMPAPTYTPRPQPTYTPWPTPTKATTEDRQPAIPFNAQMLGGSEFSLQEAYGSPTLLAFWAPW